MAKQSYGTSTGGVNRSAKGDLPSDKKFTGYNSRGALTDLSTKGSLPSDKKFSGAYGPAPKVVGSKGNPPADLPKPTGRETVAGIKAKNIPRSYVPSRIKQIFDPTPFATPVVPQIATKKFVGKKPVAVKPAAVVTNVTREKLSPTKKMPPATRFGTVTGKTTGTTVRGGGGYGGGGTRGGGSLSGGGSGTRSAGTSRTGGTQRNDPVRG